MAWSIWLLQKHGTAGIRNAIETCACSAWDSDMTWQTIAQSANVPELLGVMGRDTLQTSQLTPQLQMQQIFLSQGCACAALSVQQTV